MAHALFVACVNDCIEGVGSRRHESRGSQDLVDKVEREVVILIQDGRNGAQNILL